MRTATERLLTRAVFDTQTSCLIWGGAKQDGYGLIWYEGKLVRTHRLAWLLSYGDIPIGMQVLHKCDNRACIRLDHLFLGTQRDNIQDAVAKGRYHPTEYGKMAIHPSRYKGWHWEVVNGKREWIPLVTAERL